ncbi:MAG TPA: hypothetical protein VNN09_01185 [Candidatus Competibacteraceae bacterium]|nr:hypothetical protein [Candidatus Competibacteraceae bacterium]
MRAFATRLRAAAACALAATLLLWPALWNGFPLFFFDSVDYLGIALGEPLVLYRTLPYSAFLVAAGVRLELWPVLVVQALLAVWLLREALLVFAPGAAERRLLPLTAMLAATSGLPWYVSQFMPDVFTGLAPLGLLTLAYGRGRLPRWRRILLVLLTALAVAMHSTHLLVAAGLLAVGGLAGWWLRRRPQGRPTLAAPGTAVALAVVLILGTHWLWLGRPVLNQASPVFLLAQLLEQGLAQRHLQVLCPGLQLRLCPLQDAVFASANDFLWGEPAPSVRSLGGWAAIRDEAALVVTGTLRAYPLEFLRHALGNALRQGLMFKTGDGLPPQGYPLPELLAHHFPALYPAFTRGRQQQGIDFDFLNRWQPVLQGGALLGTLVATILAWRRARFELAGLGAGVLLALAGNALVCGAFSTVDDRYQNRLVWLALLVCSTGRAWQAQRSGHGGVAGAAPRPGVDHGLYHGGQRNGEEHPPEAP